MIACLLSLVAFCLSLVDCAWYAFANTCICLFVCVGLCVCVYIRASGCCSIVRLFLFYFSTMVHSQFVAIIAELDGRHEGLLVGMADVEAQAWDLADQSRGQWCNT